MVWGRRLIDRYTIRIVHRRCSYVVRTAVNKVGLSKHVLRDSTRRHCMQSRDQQSDTRCDDYHQSYPRAASTCFFRCVHFAPLSQQRRCDFPCLRFTASIAHDYLRPFRFSALPPRSTKYGPPVDESPIRMLPPPLPSVTGLKVTRRLHVTPAGITGPHPLTVEKSPAGVLGAPIVTGNALWLVTAMDCEALLRPTRVLEKRSVVGLTLRVMPLLCSASLPMSLLAAVNGPWNNRERLLPVSEIRRSPDESV